MCRTLPNHNYLVQSPSSPPATQYLQYNVLLPMLQSETPLVAPPVNRSHPSILHMFPGSVTMSELKAMANRFECLFQLFCIIYFPRSFPSSVKMSRLNVSSVILDLSRQLPCQQCVIYSLQWKFPSRAGGGDLKLITIPNTTESVKWISPPRTRQKSLISG